MSHTERRIDQVLELQFTYEKSLKEFLAAEICHGEAWINMVGELADGSPQSFVDFLWDELEAGKRCRRVEQELLRWREELVLLRRVAVDELSGEKRKERARQLAGQISDELGERAGQVFVPDDRAMERLADAVDELLFEGEEVNVEQIFEESDLSVTKYKKVGLAMSEIFDGPSESGGGR